MDSFKRCIRRYGIHQRVYLDLRPMYKSTEHNVKIGHFLSYGKNTTFLLGVDKSKKLSCLFPPKEVNFKL
jgi:hypothetical protein